MDPDTTLAQIRIITSQILNEGSKEGDAEVLAALFDNLDTWLSAPKLGTVPKAWIV